jgi:hypothetical protein
MIRTWPIASPGKRIPRKERPLLAAGTENVPSEMPLAFTKLTEALALLNTSNPAYVGLPKAVARPDGGACTKPCPTW